MAGVKRPRFLVPLGALIVAGGFGYLVWGGLDRNVVYFLTPQELLERGNAAYDVPVRLGGQVLPGSVMWDARRLELRFTVADGDVRIPVHSRGAPPQMFRDGIGVVVEGRYTKDGIFESTNLMVKHSNEYRAPAPGEHPRDLYKTLLKDGSQ